MNLHKLDPKAISGCSPRHIQSVIEDLLKVLKDQDALAVEVLTLNPTCTMIGQGKILNLHSLANEVLLNNKKEIK